MTSQESPVSPQESGLISRPRSSLDSLARVLIWAALGWTVAMLVVLIFFIKFAGSQTIFERLGIYAVFLALVPIAIVSLPLSAMVSRKIRRITPIVAAVTAGLVIVSIAFAGGFFIPAAFALSAAALLEIADTGNSED
jgi:hypothetical protein